MVGENMNSSTEECSTELLEDFDDREQFLFNCRVVLLCRVELASVKTNVTLDLYRCTIGFLLRGMIKMLIDASA